MAKSDSKSKTPQSLVTPEVSLAPEIIQVIKDLPKDKQQIIIRAVSVKQHSGPLPAGEDIQIYNSVIPNGGDRLMKTVEKQLEHRIEIEKIGVRRSFNQSLIGQIMAFFLAGFFGVIAWDLAKSGHGGAAGVIGTVDIVGLVTVFIMGRSRPQ